MEERLELFMPNEGFGVYGSHVDNMPKFVQIFMGRDRLELMSLIVTLTCEVRQEMLFE